MHSRVSLCLLTTGPSPIPSTAGELGSLEEVVHQFITKQYLRPVMLHELWDVASRAFQAMQARSAGAERWVGGDGVEIMVA